MRVNYDDEKKIKVLVIGLGNPLVGDDGFGPYMVDYLKRLPLPIGVEVLEGGTEPFWLLSYLERAEKVIIIDVIHTGEKLGTIYRIPLNRLSSEKIKISFHQFSLLALYQMSIIKEKFSLPDGNLIAVEVEGIETFKLELSSFLVEKASAVAEQVMKEIKKYMNDELNLVGDFCEERMI